MKNLSYLKSYYLVNRNIERKAKADKIRNGNKKDRDIWLKQYSTNNKWEKYQKGEITREKAVEIAIKRMEREFNKRTLKDWNLLETVEKTDIPEWFNIDVEWYKSYMWGYNPKAYLRVLKEGEQYGSASGCGYDKLSAAIADALNQSPKCLKILYQLKNDALKKGVYSTGTSNEKYIKYGAGYGLLPYYEGGVGVSCFRIIWENAGYESIWKETKRADYFEVTLKETA